MLFILPPLPVCDMGLLTCFWLYTSVDGYFENWGAWSTCSQTCNHGVKTRSRVCVPPNHGGQPCSDSRNEIAPCIKRQCPGIFIVIQYFKFSQFWLIISIVFKGTCKKRCFKKEKYVIATIAVNLHLNEFSRKHLNSSNSMQILWNVSFITADKAETKYYYM